MVSYRNAWNYLRVRGEYAWDAIAAGINWELPPRARRIHRACHGQITHQGTTSACAENTRVRPGRWLFLRNYLRVRGEYWRFQAGRNDSPELPPRARRIHENRHGAFKPGGTTSACAENTNLASDKALSQRNYLRVRGEYWDRGIADTTKAELPPRARRIREKWGSGRHHSGTTSACAENTRSRSTRLIPPGNYLRVRGEYR